MYVCAGHDVVVAMKSARVDFYVCVADLECAFEYMKIVLLA